MRPTARTLLPALLAIVAAALLAGCGDDESSSSTSTGADAAAERTEDGSDDDAGADAGAQADADLQVRIENVGAKDGVGLPVPTGIACDRSLPATCTEQVTCPVAEDDAAAAVCAWLAGNEARELLLDEPTEREVCTQQYGGPEVATVTGTLDGDQVEATFSRENGCAIGRYDAVAMLWTGELPVDDGPPAPSATPSIDPDAPVSSDDSEPRSIDDPPEAFDLDE